MSAVGATAEAESPVDSTIGSPVEGASGGVASGGAASVMSDRERAIEAHERRVAQVAGQLNVSHGEMALLVVEAIEHGWWQQSGIGTVSQWICWQTGVSPTVAGRFVTVATRWDDFPATTARFVAGELSLDQTYEVLRRAPASADRGLAESAAFMTVGQLRSVLARYGFDEEPASGGQQGDQQGDEAEGHAQVDPYGAVPVDPDRLDTPDAVPEERTEAEIHDPLAPDAPAGGTLEAIDHTDAEPDPHTDGLPSTDPRAEHVTLIQLEDGSWRLTGRLDADHGLVLDAAQREIRDHLFRRDGRAATSAEVLVAMAERSLAHTDTPARRDRYRVVVTLDERRELIDPFGHTLPRWIRDLITCDAEASVLWTRHGRPIAAGGPTDPIPAVLRRYVLTRDGGCRIPWCRSRHGLEVHHVVHREHAGTNEVSNLVALCRRHHRQHHRGEFTISGNPDEPDDLQALRITSPSGRDLHRPPPIVPDRPPDPAPAPYRHPPGERISNRWFHIPLDTPATGPPPVASPVPPNAA